jgi:hypothetical protein
MTGQEQMKRMAQMLREEKEAYLARCGAAGATLDGFVAHLAMNPEALEAARAVWASNVLWFEPRRRGPKIRPL